MLRVPRCARSGLPARVWQPDQRSPGAPQRGVAENHALAERGKSSAEALATLRQRREADGTLVSQAVAVLRELRALTGDRQYVFPGRDPHKPMSEAAVNAALRRMGYDTKTEITGHSFRAMARTILHQHLGFPPEVIEHQLAHRVPDALGTAYNRTKFIKERRSMMQRWADYLDKLKAGAKVIPLHGNTA